MSTLLQISDPHFGTEQPMVADALVALRQQLQPDLLVLSGDITQRASAAQFRAARTFVNRLGLPLLAIPGNHDIPLFDVWTRAFRPYARHTSAFGADLEPVHVSSDLMVVCVNTTRPWRHKHGEVSGVQIDRVARAFASASAEQLRVVVVHQPVGVTRAKDTPNLLRGHAEALQAWSAAGIDLVMGGHIHLPYVMPMSGLVRPLWAVQAGTSVSSRIRRGVPNSVNVLRWGKDSPPGWCYIEQWDYSRVEQAFVLALVTQVQPNRV